jgi:hypothetical protein
VIAGEKLEQRKPLKQVVRGEPCAHADTTRLTTPTRTSKRAPIITAPHEEEGIHPEGTPKGAKVNARA